MKCVFCKKIEEGSIKDEGAGVCSFEPLNPVTKGHLLIVPYNHNPDFTHSQAESANVMAIASKLAKNMGEQN